jgi:hypothetical protein
MWQTHFTPEEFGLLILNVIWAVEYQKIEFFRTKFLCRIWEIFKLYCKRIGTEYFNALRKKNVKINCEEDKEDTGKETNMGTMKRWM